MQSSSSLFLAQSYQDTWEDYQRSLTRADFCVWDYIVLTASNRHQADAFTAQLNERRQAGLLPLKTQFLVIPDRHDERVGSGGATLDVIAAIARATGDTSFKHLRILVIHSGGDSKRIPQYSALGKLFSPVPRELPGNAHRPSTLFDEFIIAMSSVPSRIREGMLLLSGDVLLLFNPLQIDYSGVGAAAISFKEHVSTGKNHGVFLRGADGFVEKFLHKLPEDTLRAMGAVNDHGNVDIDTGAIIFSPDMLAALFKLIAPQGQLEAPLADDFINSHVRLSLYGDFLYPLATASTFEDFLKQAPEGEFSPELLAARKLVWDALRPFRLKLLQLAPAKFIHFGTTVELQQLMTSGISDYSGLGWSSQVASSVVGRTAAYASVLSNKAVIGDNCYLEVSYVHHNATVGSNTVLSFIDIHDEVIPDNVVMHGLKQQNGRFVVRIYGIDDNPKKDCFFGQQLEQLCERLSIPQSALWNDNEPHLLWNAALYPECQSIPEAIAAALNLHALVHGSGNLAQWLNAPRKSLCQGFNDADPEAIIAWTARMQELVRMDAIAKAMRSQTPARTLAGHLTPPLTAIQNTWLTKHLQEATPSEAIRLHYYIGKTLGGMEGEQHITEAFKIIQKTILDTSLEMLAFNSTCAIAKPKEVVQLPLRVNFGGGWSDTPPYCLENGGTVLNVAMLLDGQRPVEVTLEQIPEAKIVFDSRDMDVHGEFTTIAPLQQTGDPYDPFALQKAALLACGIIPASGGPELADILRRLGGGFIMHSEVTGVPKGSGLGTSSILAAACVKAISNFFALNYSEDELYSHVLCMEQIMSTGGGWQDQVGGVTDGIKYITTRPALCQVINVQHLTLDDATKKELDRRFALIYTGQRRLARNLLREVVGRYIGAEPDSLFALNEIQKIAALMRFELERGHIDDFAQLLNRHWELSKQVDAGSSNTLIEQIFTVLEPYIDGRMICGAGGGGFLQVILKANVRKEDVHDRLKEVFQDNAIDIWPCTLVM